MKEFSLEEYLKNPDRKIVTRTGKNARIRCIDVKNELYPILALVDIGDYESPTLYTADGEYILGQERDFDLFFAPEKHEGWINLFRDCRSGVKYPGCRLFNSEKEAKQGVAIKNDRYIATIKIEWEE